MTSIIRFTLIVLGCLFLFRPTCAEESSAKHARIGVHCTLGGARTWDNWDFNTAVYNVHIPSSLYLAAGVTYDGVSFLASTELSVSAELAYVHFETQEAAPLYLYYGDAGLDIELMPLMIECALSSSGSFGPFVYISVGAAEVSFEETLTEIGSQGFTQWSFAYGFGGGLFFSPSDRIEMRMAFAGLIAPRDYVGECDLPAGGHCPLRWKGTGFFNVALRVVLKL